MGLERSSDEKKEMTEEPSSGNDEQTSPSEEMVQETKKEDARMKLKQLTEKLRSKAESDKKDDTKKDPDKKSKERQHSGKGKRKEMKDEDARGIIERRNRHASDEMERDGDWHCGNESCRFVNFRNNPKCKNCKADKPDPPVFWDRDKVRYPCKEENKEGEKKRRKSDE